MPHGRADDGFAARTRQVGHVARFLNYRIALKPLELGGSKDAVEVAAQKLAWAILLVVEHERAAGGAEDVEHPRFASACPQVSISFHLFLRLLNGKELYGILSVKYNEYLF